MSRRRIRLRVDVRSKVPAYRQIVEQVRAAVAAGTLAPGDRLPTVRALASETGIHFNTVARAYRRLDRAGMISTQQGRGSYIVDRLPADRPRHAALKGLSRNYVAAAVHLGFTAADVQRALEKALGRAWPTWKKKSGL
jgi:GntR family transcriptional regulator